MSDVIEINAETGEVTERPMTADEAAQRKADETASATAAKAKAEKDALAASARLKIAETSGLTPEEMTALGF